MNKILLRVDHQNKEIDSFTFNEFTIYHNHEESAKQTLNEIFLNNHYYFENNEKSPTIIDGGANIGIAALFFKQNYPMAKILCFEPDPNAFALLQKNMAHNKLTDIVLINSALSDKEGTIDFYGQIHAENPDARGNSVFKQWGAQRDHWDKIRVNAVKLSSYIDREIDFLKLDIEGAEECVLREIQSKLHHVKSMALEFHATPLLSQHNQLDRTLDLLHAHAFDCEVIENDMSILPPQIKDWAKQARPLLYTIKAVRKS